MTTLLRDDFTGSGALADRVPDIVGSGPWTDDPRLNGGSAYLPDVGGDKLSSLGYSWGAWVDLDGSPQDIYMQAKVIGCDPVHGMIFGVRYDTVSQAGIFVEVTRPDVNTVSLNMDIGNRPILDGVLDGTFAVANGSDFTLEIQALGSEVSILLDGEFCLVVSILSSSPGGVAYLGSSLSTTQLDSIEASTTPIVPAETINPDGTNIYKWDAGSALMPYRWKGKLWLLSYPQGFQWVRVRAKDYDSLTIKFYADGVLLHTKVVTSNKPFRLPLREDYDSIQWESIGTSRVYSVEVADDVTELS